MADRSIKLDFRLSMALAASKASAGLIRRLGRGGGTSAPGLVAERLDPDLLTKLTIKLADGAIVVAGTNGKTTTSRMIADMLSAASRTVVHNRSGSNLVRGVVSAFVAQATFRGHPGGDVAVIETDEAALPEIVRLTQPRIILLNNLFRDQLDRYGELDTIARKWRAALQVLGTGTTIVVNADDPALVTLTDDLRAPRITFGLNEGRYRLDALPHAADAVTCRICGADLAYHAHYVSHLGEWYCPSCGRARPSLDVEGGHIELRGVESLSIAVRSDEGAHYRFEAGVPGLYNAYNTLAAIAVARQVGIPTAIIDLALRSFRSAFGRIERVTYKERTLTIALVKNPVGFNEVLRMLTAGSGGLGVPTLIAINDLYADGRDVSWLWDVDFEMLANGDGALSTTGLRGADMANRLKYAGVDVSRIHPLPAEVAPAIDAFIESVPKGETAYVLPTYTAMLEIRKILASRGAVETFWQQ
jgi:UDP-N-acetylmuramyl tripeptide synthase